MTVTSGEEALELDWGWEVVYLGVVLGVLWLWRPSERSMKLEYVEASREEMVKEEGERGGSREESRVQDRGDESEDSF